MDAVTVKVWEPPHRSALDPQLIAYAFINIEKNMNIDCIFRNT